jgi:SNF2 family DNA or RNA helicase
MKNWHYFMDRYCYWTMGKYGTYQYGSRRIDELREITKPFTIKRTKKEVLPYLPEKYFRRVVLEMPPDQRKLYDQMEKDLKILLDSGEPLWAQGVLALLTRLRQINIDPKIVGVESGSAKTDFLVDLIESMDEKLVVFSCFERYIHLLSLMYPDALVVTGEVKPDERAKRVKEFQEDPSKKLFFGTIQTAGEGITLTAASTVVMMDRWWNEPSNSQATDRLHRIGQVSAVEIIIPINENSVDESLDEILQRKGSAMQEFLPERDVTRLVVDDRRQRNEPRVIEL